MTRNAGLLATVAWVVALSWGCSSEAPTAAGVPTGGSQNTTPEGSPQVAADGASLDTDFLRLIVNEADEHALETALILNDRFGGSVSVAALDAPDVDDILYTALAKGVERVVKITDVPEGLTTVGAASVMAGVLPAIDGLLPADLILTGCSAIDDLDGQIAPLLAGELELPYLGLVTGIDLDDVGRVTVMKEYSGGVRGAG